MLKNGFLINIFLIGVKYLLLLFFIDYIIYGFLKGIII